MFAVLVQSGGHAYRIRKDKPHEILGVAGYPGISMEPLPISLLQESEGNAMAGFGFERKQ
jgi:hypothetical protein